MDERERGTKQAGSELSERLGASMTPVERLALHLELRHHQSDADALLAVGCLMRHMLEKGGSYMKDGQELADMLLEALESWLPKDLKIVDA